MRAAIAQIDEAAWQPLAEYPQTGVAEIAETTLGERRLIVASHATARQAGHALAGHH